ncbi:glutamine--fructose-6-phosphate transaminase (isomerizing) [Treponema porcinum]|uniref:glutamine--fructose-6-phosphate transaminase (isomerizing) n=3 Tax=Treponema TaxID=157 RepID=UPI002A834DFA|nr:glutamine--fructose-6-phosphate transaminase (isomerizing) [Treponema porcinum]MDY4467289.1 glutamine--fructose-6-phosphate transaminase (isomerizing) [Treponema porcinum]
MCGIVGYVGTENAVPYLINGLKKLEYRGYDSSGIIVGKIEGGEPKFYLYKKAGKLSQLVGVLPKELSGSWGIGHTRWATHGMVTDLNAHPFYGNRNKVAAVHNGIIENFQQLRADLQKEGVEFSSETDSEVIPNLVEKHYSGNLLDAVQKALNEVIGTYALAITCVDEPDKIVVAKRGGPLVIGLSDNAYYIASDVNAIVGNTTRVIYLEDGDIVEVTKDGLKFPNVINNDYAKRVEEITINAHETEKCGYETYMEKEINEQPEAIERAFAGRIDMENATAKMSGFEDDIFKRTKKICCMSAGTSWYASYEGCLLFEQIARIFAYTEFSSELRYKNPLVGEDDVYLAVSQSGETADTIYAMKEIQEKGGKVFGICNVVSSTIARQSNGGAFIHAGPEIAVASTKAFSNTLIIFYLLALKFARQRGMSKEDGLKFIKQIMQQPRLVKEALMNREKIHAIAKKYCGAKDFLFLGRGLMYPIALEGALKLKEISYIHAEAFAAGEIKHGPIAMVNENAPSVFLVPDDYLREKVISNIKEIKARKGPVIAIGVEGDTELEAIVDDFIAVPKVENPVFYAIPMVAVCQLFAFYCARELGKDVDQPRNLAKSVTVE